MSVTFVHPAKAVGWNEMPFSRDTRVVPSNIVLDRGSSRMKGRFEGSEPPVRSDATYRQTTLVYVDICASGLVSGRVSDS